MKRFAVVALTVGATVALVAAPALAKGPLVPIHGRVVITGPGLQTPIDVKGKVYWYEYGLDGSKESSNQITLVVRELGLLDAGPDVGWYELPPDPSTLGPAYDVEYYSDIDLPSGVTLYPYASVRPLVFSQATNVGGKLTGLWWSAPRSLRAWLVSKGLPATPAAAPISAQPARVPQLPPTKALTWAVAFAVTGLLAMVLTAALAGRRAQVNRNRLSA